MLNVGDKAPLDICIKDQDDREICLGDLLGQKVVLYFYPKDSTPGCTTQACGIRDNWSAISATGALLFGVSPDSTRSHRNFREKQSLPFPLLADTEHRLAEAFGAWGEKSMYGRTYMGIFRMTFILDEQGTIEHVFPKVKPKEHAAELLRALGH
ncbi:thioredoxin-dependent thiol peroxidase [Desulfurispirillum indicum]|uniref:thioredoxin-dependent thiol peroxidase n=1 Tax=Desulfurispirillum indicum TaxID=936456 RepID=UPI001CFA6E29|nr:thioredoxin-dependent thiol peroxidase [Desulfurispirillum indicum]UCZ57283.1 thioredoxin-dependent thiol peroxidase [Desulfurispirillum indicum]